MYWLSETCTYHYEKDEEGSWLEFFKLKIFSNHTVLCVHLQYILAYYILLLCTVYPIDYLLEKYTMIYNTYKSKLQDSTLYLTVRLFIHEQSEIENWLDIFLYKTEEMYNGNFNLYFIFTHSAFIHITIASRTDAIRIACWHIATSIITYLRNRLHVAKELVLMYAMGVSIAKNSSKRE